MTDSERITDLERRFTELQGQVFAMSELLGSQSSLIARLSEQQMEATRGLDTANQMLGNIARLVEQPE